MQLFDDVALNVKGRRRGRIALERHTIDDQKLGKIPLDVVRQRSLKLFLEVHEQRIGIWPIDVDLQRIEQILYVMRYYSMKRHAHTF